VYHLYLDLLRSFRLRQILRRKNLNHLSECLRQILPSGMASWARDWIITRVAAVV
jgi:hypothetical protein